MNSGLLGPELLASFAGWTSVGAFLPLCPSPMSGPDPRASKSRYKIIIDATGTHQNGKHLLSPSPGSKAARTNRRRRLRSKLTNLEAKNQNKMDTPDVIEMEGEDEDVMMFMKSVTG